MNVIIDDYDFARIAQLIQDATGCGAVTSNVLTKKICRMLGIRECEGRPMKIAEWEQSYTQRPQAQSRDSYLVIQDARHKP